MKDIPHRDNSSDGPAVHPYLLNSTDGSASRPYHFPKRRTPRSPPVWKTECLARPDRECGSGITVRVFTCRSKAYG